MSNVIAIATLVSEIRLATDRQPDRQTDTQTDRHTQIRVVYVKMCKLANDFAHDAEVVVKSV